jgi:hypothetical protein
MSTPEHEHWTGRAVRRPDDVRTMAGGPVPLGWQMEKRVGHTDRLMNATLPADFPHPIERGDAGDALAVLALGESIRRDLAAQRAGDVRTALQHGATWSEVADALDTTPHDARTVLREWAEGQHRLYTGDVEHGRARPLGLDAERYAAVLALTELDDHERVGGASRD